MKVVITKSHGIMNIEEELRQVAMELIEAYPAELGHIDLSHVIFVRAEAVKLKKKSNWLGKCFFIRPEIRIICNYTGMKLSDWGLVDKDQLAGLEKELFDIRYMIVLNDVAIEDIGADKKRVERIVLHHELLHIAPDMDGNVQHDIQDFAWILDRYGTYWTRGVLPEKDRDDFVDDFVNKLRKEGTKLSMNMPAGADFEEIE